MSNEIEMACEMASEDSDWSVSTPPLNWNGIRTILDPSDGFVVGFRQKGLNIILECQVPGMSGS
jgi:hypothetical protein